MKQFILLLFCGSILLSTAQKITSKQWQDDLKFLQETVHKDYPFLFKKVSAKDFDDAVDRFNAEIPSLQDHEILIGFAKIVALFKYGHTRVGFREGPVNLHRLPVQLYQFPDGTYITAAHKDYADIVGAKITKVENVSMPNVLRAVYPVVPVENEQFFKAYSGLYLSVPEILHAQGITENLQSKIKFTLEKEGKSFSTEITANDSLNIPTRYGELKPNSNWVGIRDQSKDPYYLKNLEKIYYYEYLPEQKTVYIRHSQIQDDPTEDIPTFYNRVFDFIENNDVEKLVLDVRLNGGGNNYKNKPIITGIIEQEKINQKGKFFVIIGRRTYSACQNLVNELSNYTNAIFIGEPTGENINFYGDNRRVELPQSKLPVYLSFAWWQDKPQWENGPWLAPHIAIENNFEAYKNNQDPVLEKALNFSNTNFVTDPMAHFTKLFEKGDIETLKKDASSMVNDEQYAFFDFEGAFNKAGYNLLGGNRTNDAIFVFSLITELFPNSANAWDSLAEGYLRAGDKTKAKEYYNKAIRLDKKGNVSTNAKKMLKEIDGH